MIGVLYISSQTYGKDPLAQECNEVGFSVGYLGVVGTEVEGTTRKNGIGTGGYGIGNTIEPATYLEGCVQSEDGVLAALTLIESVYQQHALTKLIVITTDPYLVRVTESWMPEWTEHAVKGNNQLIPHSDEWIRISRLPIQFIPQLVGDYGSVQANTFSVAYKAWESTYPASQYITKQDKLNPLIHLNSIVFMPVEPITHTLQLVTAKKIIEIGNLDTTTVYGLVHLPDVPSIITQFTRYPLLSTEFTYTLEASLIKSEALGTLMNRIGTDVLAKPVRYEDVYSVGIEAVIIAPIQPAHKLYKAEGIWTVLSNLLDKLKNASLPENNAEISLKDVTQEVFPAGKIHDKLLANAKSFRVSLPIGKAKFLDVGTELPTLLALRALVKVGCQLYTGSIKVEGVYRYFYLLKTDTATGVYSPWLTKLLPA